MPNKTANPNRPNVIFRRYRRCPKTGKVLDAHRFGYRAWPIRLDDDQDPDDRNTLL